MESAYLFMDAEFVLKKYYRISRINKKRTLNDLKLLIEHESSPRVRLHHVVQYCKLLTLKKNHKKPEFEFLTLLLLSDEDINVRAFIVKFLYNHFRTRFKEVINYALSHSPALYQEVISDLTPHDLKSLTPFLEEPLYQAYSKHYQTFKKYGFVYGARENAVIHREERTVGFCGMKDKEKNAFYVFDYEKITQCETLTLDQSKHYYHVLYQDTENPIISLAIPTYGFYLLLGILSKVTGLDFNAHDYIIQKEEERFVIRCNEAKICGFIYLCRFIEIEKKFNYLL